MDNIFPSHFPTFYYHNNLKLNDDFNRPFFEGFRKAYQKQINELIVIFKPEEGYQDVCETDTDFERGVLVKPSFMFWLQNSYPHVTQEITELLPKDQDNVLIFNWLSLFNLSDQDIELVFSLYKGHVFIDDTFEVHAQRTVVMENYLKSLGYNLDNVTFWTNHPTPDNKLEDTIVRHNWLHLQEWGRTRNPNTKHKIPFYDEGPLLDYDNKKFKILSLNGHSTFPREYIFKLISEQGSLITDSNDSDELRYSFVNPWEKNRKDNNWYAWKDRKRWVPRMLPNDHDDLWIRDRSSNPQWWNESFFNLNIETNTTWRTTDARLITEKWMKNILYLTPGFNVGDYAGLEDYQKSLGFNIYENHIDRSYDSIQDFRERAQTLVKILSDKPKPDKKQWKMMNRIALENKEHFINVYIPELEKTFVNAFMERFSG